MISKNLLQEYPLTKSAFDYINRVFFIYEKSFSYIMKNFDEEYLKFSEELISNIKRMGKFHKEETHGLDAFIKFSYEFLFQQTEFVKRGFYQNSSFKVVADTVYFDETIMMPYMEGLLYSQIFWPNHYKIGRYFLTHLASMKNVSLVMDVPIGAGIFVYYMIKHLSFKRLDAFDISSHAVDFSNIFLNKSSFQLDNVHISSRNVFDLTGEKEYDLIVCGELIEHLENPRDMLVKLKTLLNNEGVIFLTTAIFAAAADHIYLFNNLTEVRNMLNEEFEIISEYILPLSLNDYHPQMDKEAINYACVLKQL